MTSAVPRLLASAGGYLRREKAVGVMLACLLGFAAVSLALPGDSGGPARATRSGGPGGEPGPLSSEGRRAAAQEFKKTGEDFLAKIQQNPSTLVKCSLIFILIMAAGLFIDVIFIAFRREGIERAFRVRPDRRASWSLGDVFAAFVVLFFSEWVMSLIWGAGVGPFFGDAVGESTALMTATFFRNLVAVIYLAARIRNRYGARLGDLGLDARGALRSGALGLATYIGFFPVYFVILLAIMGVVKLTGYEPPIQPVVRIVYEERDTRLLFAFGVFIALLGPVFEEVFFRGFIYKACREKWGVVRGAVFVSALFALLHAHWIAVIPIFALSAVLCFLFEKSGSVAAGTVMHAAHNFATLFIMFQMKALQ